MVVSLTFADELRLEFSVRLSKMYQQEVHDYTKLLTLVHDVNANDDMRLSRERHGAIRLGLSKELHFMRRLFAIYGMFPVSYYDLGIAGIPVHSTAFRPIETSSLEFCPFRIFTSVLKTDFIQDDIIRQYVLDILHSRNFISTDLLLMIEQAERNLGLASKEADKFIQLTLDVFKHHPYAITDYKTYCELKNIHPLIADVVCFKTPHINHLTPRTTDIDRIQTLMADYDMSAKAVVEGPPRRNIPILLRQTSFKALAENVIFTCGTNSTHTARFGEVEQRGFALTPKGRKLYDTLIAEVNAQITPHPDGSNAEEYQQLLEKIFLQFPDNLDSLFSEALLYQDHNGIPIIYEDFLPVSAAGIFTSNLGDQIKHIKTTDNYDAFCKALGQAPLKASYE